MLDIKNIMFEMEHSYVIDSNFIIQKISIDDEDYEEKINQSKKMWKSLEYKVINDRYYWTLAFESINGYFVLCFIGPRGSQIIKSTRSYFEAKTWLQEIDLEDIIEAFVTSRNQLNTI